MQNRKALCLSLLDRSFAAVDPTDNFHIEFRLSAIGIKTVHFLLYIVQLGVAEAGDEADDVHGDQDADKGEDLTGNGAPVARFVATAGS